MNIDGQRSRSKFNRNRCFHKFTFIKSWEWGREHTISNRPAIRRKISLIFKWLIQKGLMINVCPAACACIQNRPDSNKSSVGRLSFHTMSETRTMLHTIRQTSPNTCLVFFVWRKKGQNSDLFSPCVGCRSAKLADLYFVVFHFPARWKREF